MNSELWLQAFSAVTLFTSFSKLSLVSTELVVVCHALSIVVLRKCLDVCRFIVLTCECISVAVLEMNDLRDNVKKFLLSSILLAKAGN